MPTPKPGPMDKPTGPTGILSSRRPTSSVTSTRKPLGSRSGMTPIRGRKLTVRGR